MSVTAITDFLFLPDQEVPADFTIVLGMNRWRMPLRRAIRLHENGYAGKLIFSGGFNPSLRACEAELMAAEARQLGVGSGDIICEARSTNTRENFENSAGLIWALRAKEDVVVNIVALAVHMRRALVTAREVFPPNARIGLVSYPSQFYSAGSWHGSERGRSDVLSELRKIELYSPGNVPQEVLAAAQELVP